MNRFAATLGLAALSLFPASGQERVFPYPVRRHTLDNGLKILLIPMPSEGLAAYWTLVRTGSRDEVEPGVSGFAHFFEHMMFRGSEKLPRSGVRRDRPRGWVPTPTPTRPTTTRPTTWVSPSEDLPTVIEIEADRFQNLCNTPRPEFKTEAGAVYGEYRKGRTNVFFR